MKKQMKLSTKLMLSFGAILLLSVIIAISAFIGLNTASEGFKEYRRLAIETNTAGRIQANMLQARIDVKNFLETGEEKFADKYKVDEQQMTAFVKEIKALEFDENDEDDIQRLNDINTVETKIKDYDTAFKRVQVLYEERDDLVYNNLDVNGFNMREDLTEIMKSAYEDEDATAAYFAGRIQEHVLLGRLYMVKYLDTNDLEDVNRAKKELNGNDIKSLITTLDSELVNPRRRRLFNDFKNHKALYLDNIDKIIEVITERNNIIETQLDVIGPDVAGIIEDVKLNVKKEQDELGPQLQSSNAATIIIVISIAVGSILIAIIIMIILLRSVNKTLGGDPGYIASIAKTVSEGVLTIDTRNNKKHVGLLSDMIFMADTLEKKSNMIEKISKGDLSVEVVLASKDDEIGNSLVRMVNALNNIVNQIKSAVTQVSEGADQIADSSQSLSQGSSQQASALEEITSSINEMASQVQANTENAVRLSELANIAKDNAQQGGQQMDNLVDAMNEISQSTNDIKNIVKVIDDIAFQTNLLALNADIEAARVGKYGKGFAVVANSVRNLATKSQKSVKETTEKVEQAIGKIEKGVEVVESTAAQLNDIMKSSIEVTNIAEEVSVSSQEQAQGIEQISTGLNQIEDVVQSNSASAEENAAASEELSSQGARLIELVSYFKIDKNREDQTYLLGNDNDSEKKITLYESDDE